MVFSGIEIYKIQIFGLHAQVKDWCTTKLVNGKLIMLQSFIKNNIAYSF